MYCFQGTVREKKKKQMRNEPFPVLAYLREKISFKFPILYVRNLKNIYLIRRLVV